MHPAYCWKFNTKCYVIYENKCLLTLLSAKLTRLSFCKLHLQDEIAKFNTALFRAD